MKVTVTCRSPRQKKKNIRNKTRTLKFDLRVLREDSTKYLLITAKVDPVTIFGGAKGLGEGPELCCGNITV